jgi:hypothetical protein
MGLWTAYDAHDVAMALLIALIAAILLSVISCIVWREQGMGKRKNRMPPTLPSKKRKPTRERKPKGASKPKSENKRKAQVNQEESWQGSHSRVRQPALQPAKPRPQHPSRDALKSRAMSKSEAWLQAPSEAHATPRRLRTAVLRSEERHKDCQGSCQGQHHHVDREVLSSSLWAAAVLRRMGEGEEGSGDHSLFPLPLSHALLCDIQR